MFLIVLVAMVITVSVVILFQDYIGTMPTQSVKNRHKVALRDSPSPDNSDSGYSGSVSNHDTPKFISLDHNESSRVESNNISHHRNATNGDVIELKDIILQEKEPVLNGHGPDMDDVTLPSPESDFYLVGSTNQLVNDASAIFSKNPLEGNSNSSAEGTSDADSTTNYHSSENSYHLAFTGLRQAKSDFLDILNSEMQRVESGITVHTQLSEMLKHTNSQTLPLPSNPTSNPIDYFTFDDFSNLIDRSGFPDTFAVSSDGEAGDPLMDMLDIIERKSLNMKNELDVAKQREASLLRMLEQSNDRFIKQLEMLHRQNSNLSHEIAQLKSSKLTEQRTIEELRTSVNLLNQQMALLRRSGDTTCHVKQDTSEIKSHADLPLKSGQAGSVPDSMAFRERVKTPDGAQSEMPLEQKLRGLERELWETRERLMRVEEDQQYTVLHMTRKLHTLERDVNHLRVRTIERYYN